MTHRPGESVAEFIERQRRLPPVVVNGRPIAVSESLRLWLREQEVGPEEAKR